MAWLLILILIPYFYLLLKIYAGLLKIRPYKSPETTELFVSVIVACRNEEKSLPLLITDILSQEYNSDHFELIVVDDNSIDSSYETAMEYNNSKNLIVLKNKGCGKKKAIRTGVEACRGSLIVTTDADCRMDKEWLKTIVSYYIDNKPELVIGSVTLESRKGFFNKLQELEFLSLQGITAGTIAAGNPVMCNGANLAFRKEGYNRHAGNLHDELISGDDVFLLHSIKKESGKIVWLESEKATVITRSALTLKSFILQRARWISKARSYRDMFTVVLAIVTYITILLQLILLVAGIFDRLFLLIYLAVFLLKSIPDFMILYNTASRYKKKHLMKWFFPAQIFYPFYVVGVVLRSLFYRAG